MAIVLVNLQRLTHVLCAKKAFIARELVIVTLAPLVHIMKGQGKAMSQGAVYCVLPGNLVMQLQRGVVKLVEEVSMASAMVA